MRADTVGLYVHVPFCVRKCNYCDFCSYDSLAEKTRDDYIQVLVKEIESYKAVPKISLDTIFFGGGTPSLLTPDEFERIMCAISESFEILPKCEITLEVNPRTLSRKALSVYKRYNVNRISIGLQSIHENEQKILGRIHNFEDFDKAYKLVSEVGITNISVDVMYAIPSQTPESFMDTLKKVVSYSPTHISAYSLILEQGTKLYDNRESLNLPSEDEEILMYRTACDFLRESGYSHYEISNYAKDGFQSRHNLKYWNLESYIGVGVSAHSFFAGRRYSNPAIIKEYLEKNLKEYTTESEMTPQLLAYEYVMLGLRLSSGISLSRYKQMSGKDLLSGKETFVFNCLSENLIEISSDKMYLTEKGFYLSNSILTELI